MLVEEVEENLIISAELTDIDDLTARFTALSESYRLLVGAAEELSRTPSAPENIINAAVTRSGFLGRILDQLLVLLQLSILINLCCEDEGSSRNPYL